MGMDVYGRKPSSEVGEYFRANALGWPPLWKYCVGVAPELTNKVRYAYSNDGDGLGKRDSVALAKRLSEEIDSGRTAAAMAARDARIGALPDEQCDGCEGTGVEMHVYQARGCWLGRVTLPEEERVRQCVSCKGKGSCPPWERQYHVNADVIAKFRDFLAACGGFEIW
jgi:hypothetical protein